MTAADKVPVVAWRVSGSGQVWALRKTNPHGWTYIQPLVLATDYEAAIARAEAAERDALRWRFVRDNWHDLCTTAGIDANGNYSVTEVFIGVGEHEPYALGSVDAAIDAAIAEQQAGG